MKGQTAEKTAEIIQLANWRLEGPGPFTHERIEGIFRDLSERLDIKLRDLTRVFYVAIAGTPASTPLFRSMEILGADLVRMRLRRAIDTVGGLSAKKQKALQKEYRDLLEG